MIEIKIDDAHVTAAFNRLIALGESPGPALKAIGEKVEEFTKTRFEQSADPYGVPWAPNSDVTLRTLLHGSGKNFTKKGALSKRGTQVLAGKKPLIGESKSLSTQLHSTVGGDSVTVSSSMVYAAMQQFGGTKAEFPNLWGDIPARPFFPNAEQGLPDSLEEEISDILRIAIQNAAGAA